VVEISNRAPIGCQMMSQNNKRDNTSLHNMPIIAMSSPPVSETPRPLTLVTGGAGFLGSQLCDRLLAEGHDVVCLDNLVTGRLENIWHLLFHPRFRFVRHDVTQPIDLPSLLRPTAGRPGFTLRPLSYILHFASPASPRDYAPPPVHTLKESGLGTRHALDLARTHGSVFLFSSTSGVYGDQEVGPQPDKSWGRVNLIGPRSVYDEAKRYDELLTMAYHREYGVKVHIARIFNGYGERMRIDDSRALPTFMVRALRDKPLTVYGDGSQTRSFCHVSDLVEGLYRLLLSSETEPVDLGNPEEVSVLELAEAIIRFTKNGSRIVFEPLCTADLKRRRPDITAAREKLGWRPIIPLATGLARTLPYFQGLLHEGPEDDRTLMAAG
jgi:dTDP-glucose 4,6-dehydratase